MQQERAHTELPHFGSCKHCTPQKCLPLSRSLALNACLGAIFFSLLFDYQFYFSVSCECPFSIQTTQCPNTYTLFICVHIVMPTCLIYCCTRIPKTESTTMPHEQWAFEWLSLSLSLPLILCLNLHCHPKHFFTSGLFKPVQQSVCVCACPFHIHVFRFIKGIKLIVAQQQACSFYCFFLFSCYFPLVLCLCSSPIFFLFLIFFLPAYDILSCYRHCWILSIELTLNYVFAFVFLNFIMFCINWV